MAKPFAEAVELAQHVLGQDGADLDGLDVALDERWGVSFATSEEIANELLALTIPFKSPLGGLLQAFVRPDGAAMVALMRGPSCAVLLRVRASRPSSQGSHCPSEPLHELLLVQRAA